MSVPRDGGGGGGEGGGGEEREKERKKEREREGERKKERERKRVTITAPHRSLQFFPVSSLRFSPPLASSISSSAPHRPDAHRVGGGGELAVDNVICHARGSNVSKRLLHREKVKKKKKLDEARGSRG